MRSEERPGASRLTLAILVLLCACTRQSPPTHPERWARAWISAMNSRSVEQVVGLFGKGGTYEAPGTNGPISDGQLAWFLNAIWQVSTSLIFVPERVTAEGDRIRVEWHVRNERKDGQVVTFKGVTEIEVEGSHIRRARTFFPITESRTPGLGPQ
ncbi:MAG: nuclear transport factor 2 family protein [Candidatus Binatia bacterium]